MHSAAPDKTAGPGVILLEYNPPLLATHRRKEAFQRAAKKQPLVEKRACRATSCRAAIPGWLAVDDTPLLNYAR